MRFLNSAVSDGADSGNADMCLVEDVAYRKGERQRTTGSKEYKLVREAKSMKTIGILPRIEIHVLPASLTRSIRKVPDGVQ